MRSILRIAVTGIFLWGLLTAGNGFSQERPPQMPKAPPAVNSPEVLNNGKIIFRIYAPKADSVGLQVTDIFGMTSDTPKFSKGEDGIWECTIGPVDPGAYRYTFMVNGVQVVDPRNPSVSESNSNAWSLVYVPGAAFMEAGKTAHGSVSTIHYFSSSLGRNRRMHIYTPPGYARNTLKYPVFYLLHGAGDCDDSWSSVGRAGFILDNLIAEKKAKPMIVVMPAGHTSSNFSMGGGGGIQSMVDDFSRDFIGDIMPYVEANYRLLPGINNRAIAGLSMGGMQTLNIAISDVPRFAYVGVFSSGIFGAAPKTPAAPAGAGAPALMPGTDWEQGHQGALKNVALKKNLKLLWFATGTEDFLLNTTRASLDMLKKHGFSPVYKESGGGHTWTNWRNYLNDFAPQLFN